MTEQNALLRTESNGLQDLDSSVANPPPWLIDALSVPREEGTIEVDGCDIHFFRWGDPSKPGLLLLHGFLAHARCFAFIAPFLAADYHIVAYDFSGMGDSGSRDSYPEQVRVKELLGVAEQTGLFADGKVPTIVAHSYGGHIGTAAMHAYAERFSGLIICDLMILRPEYLKANAERFRPPGHLNAGKPNKVYDTFEAAKKRFVLSPKQPVEEPSLFDYMAYHSLRQVDGGWSWKFDPSVFNREQGFEKKWMETAHQVALIPGKRVIIHGQDSVLFNADSCDYMRETVQELDTQPLPIIGVPVARHHLMLDQPLAFVSALRSVLELWQSEG